MFIPVFSFVMHLNNLIQMHCFVLLFTFYLRDGKFIYTVEGRQSEQSLCCQKSFILYTIVYSGYQHLLYLFCFSYWYTFYWWEYLLFSRGKTFFFSKLVSSYARGYVLEDEFILQNVMLILCCYYRSCLIRE